MTKMWTSNEEFDFETARDYASKLVLLACAHRAGIFESLSEEKNIAALKHKLNADERALFIVLEALCALGYVHKRLDRYIISEKARSLFLERGETYVGGSLPHFLYNMEAWLKLPGIIKGAKHERVENVAAFMHAMASRPDKAVEEAVEHCLSRKSNAQNVLDLGGGPGKYAKAFVNRGLNVVLYDMPDIIEYVRTHFGLGEVRGRSPMAEMFAVNMLANTEEGSTYTETQYREWLTDAGFHKIEIIDLAQNSNQLILAFLG
jgi:hypothetical protein